MERRRRGVDRTEWVGSGVEREMEEEENEE